MLDIKYNSVGGSIGCFCQIFVSRKIIRHKFAPDLMAVSEPFPDTRPADRKAAAAGRADHQKGPVG